MYILTKHKKKGIELLLDAWKSMEDKYPDWNVKIAGRRFAENETMSH